MPNYNFLNLSPPEFEELTRDLLQKELNLTLESFTDGRDDGIDLRYSHTKEKNLIVQCKRYSSYNSLLSNLKKEVDNVNKLKPENYIIATSVGLTPQNKTEILELFKPFINKTSNILGKDDLNNLLGKFPEVESLHYKLWLSSINILQKILHSKIYNQSNFEEVEIEETIKTYVENDSFRQALQIIKENNFVIISGIPGIGKTTLARVLVYYFLANDFDEFVFLSDSINDAYTTFKDSTSQVFFFDDFLGRNFLDKNLSNNEEQRIVRFIETVRKSKNKVLIFTTREYILKQAKQKYDVFEDKSLEIAKCIIDLSQYTRIIRAKILYNHIYFSNLKKEFIQNILEKKSYLWIIDHPNFNPRLIQTIIKDSTWHDINPKEYSDQIKIYLDNPEEIWRHAFENQISKLSQCILANLLSAGTPILLEDLNNLIQSFFQKYSDKYGVKYGEIEFNKSIKEIEDTFIKIEKDEKNQFAVEYLNPSVQDFLVNYFNNSTDFVADVLSSAIFYNQLFRVFSLESFYPPTNKNIQSKNKILVKEIHKDIILEKIFNEFDSFSTSSIYRISYEATNSFRWIKRTLSVYSKLSELIAQGLNNNVDIEKFVIEKFAPLISPNSLTDDDFGSYLQLLENLKDEYKINRFSLIEEFSSKITSVHEVGYFTKLQDIFPKEYEEFVKKNDVFVESLIDVIEEEIDYVNLDSIEDFNSDFTDALENIISINGADKYQRRVDNILSELSDQLEKKSEYDDFQYDQWKERGFPGRVENTIDSNKISSMFSELVSKYEDD